MKDERGVVLNWLVKLILGLAIGGVILFDTASIVVNFFGLDSAADEVANQITTNIAAGAIPESDLPLVKQCVKSPTVNELCRQLNAAARKHETRLLKANVDQKGNLKLRFRRTADTLVVDKIGFIEDWAVATVESSSSTKPQ